MLHHHPVQTKTLSEINLIPIILQNDPITSGSCQSLKQRRAGIERLYAILSIANEGASKTQIVYQANLNFRSAEKELAYLQSKGLVLKSVTEGTISRYFLTSRGENILKLLTQVALNVPELLGHSPKSMFSYGLIDPIPRIRPSRALDAPMEMESMEQSYR